MKWLFLILLLVPVTAKAEPVLVDADHDQMVHDTLHLATSYMINDFGYRFYNKVFQMEKGPAMIFSSFTTLVVGLSYKMMERHPGNVGRSMLYNGMGVGLSSLAIFVLDF